jgi:hypothetical protein
MCTKSCSESLKEETTYTRSRRRWEDNIKIDLREIEWEGVDWIYLAQGRNHWWGPYKVRNYLTS